jgi:hypothetical protein
VIELELGSVDDSAEVMVVHFDRICSMDGEVAKQFQRMLESGLCVKLGAKVRASTHRQDVEGQHEPAAAAR